MKTVFVMVSSGNWDGSFSDITVYADKPTARRAFLEATESTAEIYLENYDEQELTIDIDADEMSFELYITGDYDYYNHTIYVVEKPVVTADVYEEHCDEVTR